MKNNQTAVKEESRKTTALKGLVTFRDWLEQQALDDLSIVTFLDAVVKKIDGPPQFSVSMEIVNSENPKSRQGSKKLGRPPKGQKAIAASPQHRGTLAPVPKDERDPRYSYLKNGTLRMKKDGTPWPRPMFTQKQRRQMAKRARAIHAS